MHPIENKKQTMNNDKQILQHLEKIVEILTKDELERKRPEWGNQSVKDFAQVTTKTLANKELEDKYIKATATWNGKQMNETNFKVASEQPKKEYEILECMGATGKKHPYQKNTCLGADKEVLPCTIFSVRRISDNEVFSIGDEVISVYCGMPLKILSFNLSDNGGLIALLQIGVIELKYLQPQPKKPLFTTEDGVEIFEGGEYFLIDEEKWISLPKKAAGTFISPISIFKTFSTKEKAEEYIFLNKPCLSVNDLLEIEIHRFCFENGFVITKEKLIELAKQKINKQ